MKKAKKKKLEHNMTYAVIGLGRFGAALANELASKGVDLVVVDRDPNKIRHFRQVTENAFIVDNVNKSSLKKIGVENVDVAIVCIAHQIDSSILITLDLINLGIPRVIAKAQNANHGVILEKIGAEVVYPERDMAVRLANRLENSKTLDYIRLSEKINITKVKVTEKSNNKSILDLKIRAKYGCNVIAIESNDVVNDNVHPDSILHKNDIIYVTGSNEKLDRLIKHI